MTEHRTIDQLKQQQRMLQIFIFSFITVVIWIGLSLLKSQKTTQVDATLKQQAIPLTPTIDSELFDRLQEKKHFSESELQDFPIYKFIVSQDSGTEQIVTIDVEEETSSPALASNEEENQSSLGSQLEAEQAALEAQAQAELAASSTDSASVVIEPAEPVTEPETSSNETQSQTL